ncbi:hypothetical protein [Massilia glaciei]|uniref:Uncharacterized protein n=1 Tax=Massilia glaciei TaxID=1524097 RepID=A0A2U2HLT2_9BURK|nr:hypothetical protein [Massilia glaciei]PWF48474.1 hypothetical protein C7C56_011605 [Massilia glaciei]
MAESHGAGSNAFGRHLLVVSSVPLANWGFDASWVDTAARVTGTVRILQAADVKREYGRGVNDKLFRTFEGQPAIVARSVEKPG